MYSILSSVWCYRFSQDINCHGINLGLREHTGLSITMVKISTVESIIQLTYNNKWQRKTCICIRLRSHTRDHPGHGLAQWETTLQCNVVSHWLSPCTGWSLHRTPHTTPLWVSYEVSVMGVLEEIHVITRQGTLCIGRANLQTQFYTLHVFFINFFIFFQYWL